MPTMRPLYGGCPLLGGSVMGGSTVYTIMVRNFGRVGIKFGELVGKRFSFVDLDTYQFLYDERLAVVLNLVCF